MSRYWSCLLTGCVMFHLGGCAGGGGAATSGAITPASEFLNTHAEVAVVDFFDMYCHSCQSGAKNVEALHQLVQQRGLGSRIQFYAVGIRNTALEADLYRTRFKVSFPVIADVDGGISAVFGDSRPPLLMALRKRGGTWEPFHQTHDLSRSPEELLSEILPGG